MARSVSVLLAALLLAGPAAAAGETDAAGLWAALAKPGHVALMRHAEAPGTGDPAGFRLGDCATQRNLDERGRAQARAVGEAFRRRGVAVAQVLTSQWCRARETAELMALGPVVEEPAALNSFFGRPGEKEGATAALRSRLRALPSDSAAVVMVSHQVNITALTGVFPRSGEIVVLRREADGGLRVIGRLSGT